MIDSSRGLIAAFRGLIAAFEDPYYKARARGLDGRRRSEAVAIAAAIDVFFRGVAREGRRADARAVVRRVRRDSPLWRVSSSKWRACAGMRHRRRGAGGADARIRFSLGTLTPSRRAASASLPNRSRALTA